jgi:hypothetical protein
MINYIFKLSLALIMSFIFAICFAFLMSGLIGFYLPDHSGSTFSGKFESAIFFAKFSTWGSSLFLGPSILLLSVPLHHLASKLGRVRGSEYAVAGAVVGTLLYALVRIGAHTELLGLDFPEQMAVPALVIAPVIGAAAALGFWIVLRPDKAETERQAN